MKLGIHSHEYVVDLDFYFSATPLKSIDFISQFILPTIILLNVSTLSL